jgi:hypothetical protein
MLGFGFEGERGNKKWKFNAEFLYEIESKLSNEFLLENFPAVEI